MRDNHEGMPEILDPFKEGEHYFGLIAVEIDGITKKFRFGVSRKGCLTLKNILQLRPFDTMPGLKYRYFLASIAFRIADRKIPEFADFEVRIRIEQGNNGKTMTVGSPKDLAQNLIWFNELKDFNEAAHLQQVL